MKRTQIYMETDLDQAVANVAARERRSKAAVIRDCIREQLDVRPHEHDPLDALVGRSDAKPGSIDDIVYR